MTQIFSIGLGVGTQNTQNEWLEVFYPQPLVQPATAMVEALGKSLNYQGGNQSIAVSPQQMASLASTLAELGETQAANTAQSLSSSTRPLVCTVLENDEAPQDVPSAYLKLHLISHRLAKPHQLNISGIFAVLPNNAWTNEGAIDLNELTARQTQARMKGQWLSVNCVDKFPKMTDYVVPKGVRIADTSRVRLGAYVGEGTTVMHEGFINFNAGTVGKSMIEGRISAGVLIGEGSDLGGGCSTMGTLSGGGEIIISVGEECLIGANAGIGIPLGDRCTVEAGLYITAGSKVALLDDTNTVVKQLKARELAGKSDLLFRRNSVSGAIECKANRSAIALNEELHANN